MEVCYEDRIWNGYEHNYPSLSRRRALKSKIELELVKSDRGSHGPNVSNAQAPVHSTALQKLHWLRKTGACDHNYKEGRGNGFMKESTVVKRKWRKV